MPQATAQATIVLLWVLYFVQGLPFGFQSKSLPLLLRERGFDLRHIGYANLLSLPWTCKFLVAPFVDRWGAGASCGHRKVWILPMQVLLICACLGAAWITEDLEFLMPAVLSMNFITATMDIAVDGLALDALQGDHELGWGNVAQTVGYKMGMIIGGGVLLQVAEVFEIGWSGFFTCMAGCVAVSLLPLALYDEAASTPRPKSPMSTPPTASSVADEYRKLEPSLEFTRTLSKAGQGDGGATTAQQDAGTASVRDVARTLCQQMQTPAGLRTIAIVFSYKFGEAVSDNMFKPFLLDQGFTKADISLWSGVYGMWFSTAGSLAGGFVVRRMAGASDGAGKPNRRPEAGGVLLRAVAGASALEAVAQLGRLWTASVDAAVLSSWFGRTALQALICYESFCGGLLTTIIFTYMMSSVDRSIGATHYTMLSTVELMGKSIPSVSSGLIAEAFGYKALFAFGAACSIVFVALAALLCGPRVRGAAKAKEL